MYAKQMLDIYVKVVSHGKPNFLGPRIPLLSNIHFNEWLAILHSDLEKETLQFIQYRVPVGFEGPIPTPTMGNHPSATFHPQAVTACIGKEIGEGAMLSTCTAPPPFVPWCQTNPLITHPKPGSMDRQVTMELSWLLPPDCT